VGAGGFAAGAAAGGVGAAGFAAGGAGVGAGAGDFVAGAAAGGVGAGVLAGALAAAAAAGGDAAGLPASFCPRAVPSPPKTTLNKRAERRKSCKRDSWRMAGPPGKGNERGMVRLSPFYLRRRPLSKRAPTSSY
jgi:hypothetical protein